MNGLLLSVLLASAPGAKVARLDIDADRPTVTVSKSLYGIFFEEINHAGDGGIYAELLNNRGFERSQNNETPLGWVGGVIDGAAPFNQAHPRTLRIDTQTVNDGFWGINLRKGASYRLVCWARGSGALTASLSSGSEARFETTNEWTRFEKVLRAGATDPKGKLTLKAEQGPVWLAWASLKPLDTWKGHGLRKDLAKRIQEIAPAFVRFPGGCFIEANNLRDRFHWDRSIGPEEAREGLAWSMWGYPITFGLGFHEYLQWCEDLGAAPLFVANCGISHSEIVPMDQMGPYVDEVVNAIEYANGPVTSRFGALRAKNGHPKPFHLKYVEIGNENGASWSFGGQAPYAERYRLIYDAIKKSDPNIVTIADNPVPHPTETLDEHYYSNPSFFWRNKDRYDAYSRKGPRIYVGEYAVTQDCGRGNLKAALSEAAFMTGMERNSDVVTMASYAPLFENVNARQWNPNAIVFDSSRSYGTPSYWVQQLFSRNRPDTVVSSKLQYEATSQPITGGIGLGTWRTSAEYKDIRYEIDGKPIAVPTSLDGWRRERGKWSVEDDAIVQTALDQDQKLMLETVPTGGQRFSLSLKARKRSGDEGFLIVFGATAGDSFQWNIGGWGNTQHCFQQGGARLEPSVDGSIETGRWYDVRVEGEGRKLRGYLDGKLIQEIAVPAEPSMASIVGIDQKRHELVIKLVNGADVDQPVRLNLGKTKVAPTGTVTLLSGKTLADENDLEHPERVAPKRMTLGNVADGIIYRLPARSLAILRLRLL